MKVEVTIKRIVYSTSDGDGFNILACRSVNGDSVTVKTSGLAFKEDGVYEFDGYWVNDATYGQQFQAKGFSMLAPRTAEGIKLFLSRYIRGIGPIAARDIVKQFGVKTFEILDETPRLLMDVRNISRSKYDVIMASWDEHRKNAKVLAYMEDRGCSGAAASKILDYYKSNAMGVVENDPYRVIQDVKGIGFKTADAIALSCSEGKPGIGIRSIARVRAAVIHVMNELSNAGETAIHSDMMLKSACKLLGMSHHSEEDCTLCKRAIGELIGADVLIEELLAGKSSIFRTNVHRTEAKVAKMLERLNLSEKRVEMDLSIKYEFPLSPSQKAAIKGMGDAGVTIITGSPGVGKTTIVKEISRSFKIKDNDRPVKIIYCSPTGRAAKRLSDSVHAPAATIHRTLGFDGTDYLYNEDHLLDCDVVILDEASMLDLWLTNSLLKAIPLHAKVILVGDEDQLPSVGVGAILRDLISSDRISVSRLTEVHRQKAGSGIISNALRINRGLSPIKEKDFFLFDADKENIQAKTVNLACKMAEKLDIDVKEIQILTPMHDGSAGTIALNKAMQEAVNPNPVSSVQYAGNRYGVGDKVIQVKNDHVAKIYNGDSGVITQIDKNDNVQVTFEGGREYTYDDAAMKTLGLAWALSVHKAQGSEYAGVVLPVSFQHYTMLARNLFYTGVTRGKEMVAVVGDKKAIHAAVSNTAGGDRLTGFKEQLQKTKLKDINEINNDMPDWLDDIDEGQRIASTL